MQILKRTAMMLLTFELKWCWEFVLEYNAYNIHYQVRVRWLSKSDWLYRFAIFVEYVDGIQHHRPSPKCCKRTRGFIDCPAANDKFGRDVFIHKARPSNGTSSSSAFWAFCTTSRDNFSRSGFSWFLMIFLGVLKWRMIGWCDILNGGFYTLRRECRWRSYSKCSYSLIHLMFSGWCLLYLMFISGGFSGHG